MLHNYTTYKQRLEIDSFFENILSIDDLSIFGINENKLTDNIKNFIKDKFKTVIDKLNEWIPKIAKGGLNIAKKCLEIIKKVASYLNKFLGKHQSKIIALIVMMLVMMVVTVTMSYASTGGDPNNISELANVSLSILEQWGSTLASEKGMSGNEINIAKSILTEIRDSGVKIDYSYISEKAQLLVDASIKHASKIKSNDSDMYEAFIEMGKGISSKFIYTANNMGDITKTIIGK